MSSVRAQVHVDASPNPAADVDADRPPSIGPTGSHQSHPHAGMLAAHTATTPSRLTPSVAEAAAAPPPPDSASSSSAAIVPVTESYAITHPHSDEISVVTVGNVPSGLDGSLTSTSTSAAEAPASANAGRRPLFAQLRTAMERNTHHWHSNLAGVLRPLVQHSSFQMQPGALSRSVAGGPSAVTAAPSPSTSSSSISSMAVPMSHSAASMPTQWNPASISSVTIAASAASADAGEAHSGAAASSATHRTSTSTVINVDDALPGGAFVPATQTASIGSIMDMLRRPSRLQTSGPAPLSTGGGGSAPVSPLDDAPSLLNGRAAADGRASRNAGSAGSGGTQSTAPGSPSNAQTPDIFVQIPEVRQFCLSLMRYIPYVLLVLVKFMFDHFEDMLDLVLLLGMFWHANHQVKKQIGRQKQRSVLALIRELSYVLLVLAFFGLSAHHNATGDGATQWSNQFLNSLSAPLPSNATSATAAAGRETLRSMLYNVLVTDMMAKLVTVMLKMLVTMMPPSVVNYRNRGRIYMFMESLSQLIRSMLPITSWVQYLMDDYDGYGRVFGLLLAALYIVAKGADMVHSVNLFVEGVGELFKMVKRIGADPTKEELQAAGELCAICHDSYTDPMKLSCSHIFCEACVATWFDREPTCPLCRALVGDDPTWRDGATSYFMQFY